METAFALRGRVVFAGVGCRGRGDDAFGPILVERLDGIPWIHAIDCGDRIEDYTGDIARASPDTIVVADAVDMGEAPGAVAIVEADAVGTRPASGTHRASLRAVMEYLHWRTSARVVLLGVQPAPLSDCPTLSPEVAATVDSLVRVLASRAPCPAASVADGPVPGSEESP